MEKFIKISKAELPRLYKLTRTSDYKVMLILLGMMEYSTGEIKLTARDKADIATQLGWSTTKPVYAAMKRLKDAGILTGKAAYYNINPKVASFGPVPRHKPSPVNENY